MFPWEVFGHVLELFAFANSENSNKFLTQQCRTVIRQLKFIAIMFSSFTRLCSYNYLLFSFSFSHPVESR